MLTRTQLRIRLVGLVGGLFATIVRCMAASGYVLGARAARGDGELYNLEYATKAFGQVGLICILSVAFGNW